MRYIVCFIFCLLSFVSMAGCLALSSPPDGLTRHTWRLVSYTTGTDLVGTGPGTAITLNLLPDGQVSGNTGFNDYLGEYQVEGGLISIRVLSAIESHRNVSEGVMEMEQTFFLLLNNTTRYSIDQDSLILSYYDERKLLVFEKQ